MSRFGTVNLLRRAATAVTASALIAGIMLAAPAPASALSAISTITSMTYTSGKLYKAAPDDDEVATWASGTTDYTLRITRASVTLVPTVAAGATWTCEVDSVANDDCYATGLAVGDTAVFEIEVTSQDEAHSTTYTITAERYSTDASLNALTIDEGTLTPSFDEERYSYTASTDADSITLSPTENDGDATSKCYKASTLDADCDIPLTAPSGTGTTSNVLKVVVTAPDGSTTKTYTVTVTRVATSNANVIGFSLDHGGLLAASSTDSIFTNATFSSATTSYDITTNSGSLTVTPILANDNSADWDCDFDGASIEADQDSGDTCTVTPDSTARDLEITVNTDGGATKTYTFTVKRHATVTNDVAPGYTVGGTGAKVGTALTVDSPAADWSNELNATSFFRRWYTCTSDHGSDNDPDAVPADCTFNGGTGVAYTPKPADVGKYVLVAITGHPGSVLAYADGRLVSGAPAMKDTALPPVPKEQFLISTDVGDTVDLDNDATGDFTGISGAGDIYYTWVRCTNAATSALFGTAITVPASCNPIRDGAGVRITTSTYTAGADDVGKYIRVRIILRVTGFPDYQILSRSTNRVYGAPIATIATEPSAPSAPSLTVAVPQKNVSASNGSWTGFPTPPTSTASAFSYKWYYCTRGDRSRTSDPETRTFNGDQYCWDTGETTKTISVTTFYCGFYLMFGVAIDNTVRGHGGLSAYQYSPTSTLKVAGAACN